jgi:hypothetical protein
MFRDRSANMQPAAAPVGIRHAMLTEAVHQVLGK